MAQTSSWLTRAIAFLIVGLVIGIAVGYFLYPTVSPTGGVSLPPEIKIGALLTLSGELETFGKDHQVVLELAQQEANAYLQKAGIPSTVKVYVEDTATDPNTALQKLQALAAQGIKFYIGPLSSAEARNILKYANDNNLLLLSQSSTAVDLAIPGDNLYRITPNDAAQGVALAVTMKTVGIQYVVIIHRNDVYGKGLAQSVMDNFRALGGQTSDLIPYDPKATEFTAQVATLVQYVQNAINQVGDPKKVGVELVAFEEAAVLIKTIVQNPQYDQVLRKVRWFGSDGTADSAKLTEDPDVAKFCADTKFLNTITAPATENEITQKVKNYVKQRLGREPDSYAYNVYDAFWLYFWAILSVGYDVNKVKQVLPIVAQGYVGASGPIAFEDSGDRVPVAYVLRVIDYINNTWQWTDAGKYLQATKSVTLLDKYK
ncbi:MAG: penicillin-binding protein activator [Thermoproteota archaeon]|jgi:branched-chain amino acid transport system substrate-binding protein|nr:penicillin-binding protein activator [Thermoproteota archaeon]